MIGHTRSGFYPFLSLEWHQLDELSRCHVLLSLASFLVGGDHEGRRMVWSTSCIAAAGGGGGAASEEGAGRLI